MKNKPTRHKETNSFKFKPFSERIADIDVDVFHRVAHRNEINDDEKETHFYQALQKWNVLNLTERYSYFKKEVKDIVTLPQLLNSKQHVIDTLIKYLRMKDVLFLQPILELVVALARDLQKDFYEYFPEFLAVIIDLLQTKDTEQLEYTFTALAYLFKFLWRYLIKNVGTVFDLLLPLLADSQPEYMNNFAAESFAFVVRKVKDKDEFLRLVLTVLEEQQANIPGCSKLLFEVVSGTPGQFHSCAEHMLMLYFGTLQDTAVNKTVLYNILEQILNCILNAIHPQKSEILWTVLLRIIDQIIEKQSTTEELIQRDTNLCLILKFLHQIIEHKGGKMLVNPVPVIKKIVQMIDFARENKEILEELSNISAAILLASNIKLMQENSSHLALKILSIKDINILYKVVEQLISYSSFETLVLPYILQHNIHTGFNGQILRLLAKIIIEKAAPSLSGGNLEKWKRYPLDIRAAPMETANYIQNNVELLQEINISDNALRTLIILPHLNPLPKEIDKTLSKGIISINQKLFDFDDNSASEEFGKLSFAFLLAVETAIHILEPNAFYDFIIKSDVKLTELCHRYKSSSNILNSLDLILSHIHKSQYRDNIINKSMFIDLNKNLAPSLGSPIRKVRLTVSHLYSLFHDVDGLMISTEITAKNALQLPYLAESELATVHTYRDRLLHVQALAFQSHAVSNLNPSFYEFPLYYLLGNLYINFSLLWDPVSKIIATYANKECAQFWPIFLAELNSVNATQIIQYQNTYDCDVVTAVAAEMNYNDDKTDVENYKLLLWKCMTGFVEFCETKNRDLTGLFIDFVDTNFFKINSEDSKSCNIAKHKETIVVDNQQEEHSDDDEKEETVNKSDFKPPKFENSRNFKLKYLLAQMEIFSKISNPKTLYREAEVYKIYLDLLSSKNPQVQKAALNCLMTYKHKYLQPYKEHLYNLVDEKNLKNELARFKIDKESNMIQEDHRAGLVPILMRIIYAKMVMKTGLRTGGKGGGLARRTIILRFLAGSQEEEMMIFTKMAFKLFQKYVPLALEDELNPEDLVQNTISTIDLTSVIPPKRLQSSVNLLAIVIEQFGGKMASKLLPRLLGIVFCILAQVTGILRMSDNVHQGYLSSIRNVRTSSIGILARFFAHFENYEWTSSEIDALFNVAVFPWLEKLPIEGIHSPTALLKLFVSWSQNSRYYPLLVKHRQDDPTMTPLPYVMRLLLGAKTHPSVIKTIVEMIEKMLTLEDYGKVSDDPNRMEVDVKASSLTGIVKNTINIDLQTLPQGINYGSAILLPHVSDILEYIKRKLKKSNKGVNKAELMILSRVSELVSDPETCDTLLTLVVPILIKKATLGVTEEVILELVTTVINLTKNVKKPEIHIRSITPLLSVISAAPARKLLIQLFETISTASAEEYREIMIRNSQLLATLNAWDHRWIDQPDFQKRLDAFSEINVLLKTNSIRLEFGVAIIYNCFFFLKHENDLALRDASGQCLKTIGPVLAKAHKDNNVDRKYLIDDTILTIVRNGIRSKNEVVRLQSIAFLGQMAMECPDVHAVLRDLSPLTNKADPEVDFFENLQHLQLHRKARALLKFCSVAKTLKKSPNPKTLTQFILPVASSYLCNESFANKNSIVDAAIETVGTVCRLLPWHQYEVVLKFYLDKLRSSVEFQRQVVRIIVAILDAFHYDLAKYKPLDEPKHTEKSIESAESKTEPQDFKEEILTEENNEEDNQEDEAKLDEALDKEIVHHDEVEEKDNEEVQPDILIMQKQILLSQSAARRVVFGISKVLLPQLHRSIMARTQHESSHKVNRRKTGADREEEELMRVPIALAVVKLLQKLPEGMLDNNLPGILMKLCTFLKSRLDSIRRVTRETLQKIMITLGPNYLHHLLREMNSLLTKGFQIHVLVYTIHAVLISLKPFFEPLHINKNLQSILSVCKVDLFGLTAEEKEIAGIVKNVSEAKSTKSFDIFNILGKYITESCLVDLIVPLRDVLVKTHSFKVVRKIVECLRHIVLGLADNTFIPVDKMLIFLYGIVSESIPHLLPTKKNNPLSEKEAQLQTKKKPDCFIIQAEPKSRMGIKAAAKISINTNAHVMIEFGLKLFHVLLKRDRISNAEFKPYIDPFVPVLSDCLKSQHVKLSALTLQCLNWILKMELPSMKSSVSDICTSMFGILHKYAAAGLSKGDNFDLVMASFKCMSVLVRDVKHFTISNDQLKALVLYAEQDLHDCDKQATAFTLIKAIISRKMVISEMNNVMEKVAMLSITSELDHVRQQSRSVFYMFLMEYPLGKKIEKHLSFYLSQLSYELQPGRLSALEMIHSIITGFPLKVLIRQSGLLFFMVGARLVNDDDPTCRKLCAKCIKEMIIRVPHNQRTVLFDIVLLWLKDTKISHRQLAAQLCGIFVTAEKNNFETRLPTLLPMVLKQFYPDGVDESKPGRFVKLRKETEHVKHLDGNSGDPERIHDHHLFQVLQLLLKISANCPDFLKNKDYESTVRGFAEHSQSLLAHPHLWIRLAACQLLGFILAALDIDLVAEHLKKPDQCDPDSGYIYCDPINTIRSLVLDLAAQLHPEMTFEELADQVVKNLIFIARVIKDVGSKTAKDEDENEIEKNSSNDISLLWLVKRMRKVINIEITQAPKSTGMRTAVFKWSAGVVATIPIEYLKPVLFNIMSPLVREMSTIEESNAPLRQLAKEVATMIKKRLGSEDYTRILSNVQKKLDTRRAEKKKTRTQQFVTDPELAAKRKIARQQKKKEAKKRKMDSMKGRKPLKKKPRKDVDLDVL
ncbi:small subunit processome component 20 homolog [Cephus cinctus]|uniref:Small subunit processome component 20 homolog n=1 Tax=Cephus cinctus TaxID=211228 RepID=A0AAJ7C0F9_CEPCN|nr:small subunit processome component 20 homolog [Cephus cinctus]